MNTVVTEENVTNVRLPWSAPVEVEAMDIATEAERDATQVRRATFNFGPRIEPAGIAERLGVGVFESDLDERTLGALFMKPGKDPWMTVNLNDSLIRRRLTCALELGHFVRQSAKTSEYSRVDLRDPRPVSDETTDEVYAKEFGACLLMPKVAVETFLELGLDDLEMALCFVVSREAMQNRLTRLGLEAARLGASR
jgi:Zn-dependent peptidase ImmA (M78 family)